MLWLRLRATLIDPGEYMVRFAAALAAAFLTVWPDSVSAQTAEAGRDAVEARLASEAGYAGVFGVTRDGRTALGALGRRGPEPHDPGEILRWASVSKMITAILVFQQVDAGTLDLDAPVSRYVQLPTLPNADRINPAPASRPPVGPRRPGRYARRAARRSDAILLHRRGRAGIGVPLQQL